jgi:hypothetical protein
MKRMPHWYHPRLWFLPEAEEFTFVCTIRAHGADIVTRQRLTAKIGEAERTGHPTKIGTT